MLKCDNLTKTFGGLTALDRVGFSARAHAITAIIGPNGAGKTTLFNVLTGFLKPRAGSSVRFLGRDITGVEPHVACRLGIARTFQVPKLFGDLTVLQNTTIAALSKCDRVADARARAIEVIESLGLGRWSGQVASTLPIGHRKKLELARALATRPQLVLLDEIMGGLSQAEVDETIGTLESLKQSGITFLMIEHVMRAVMAISEWIVVIDHGAKIAEGLPADVVNDARVVDAYLGGDHSLARR